MRRSYAITAAILIATACSEDPVSRVPDTQNADAGTVNDDAAPTTNDDAAETANEDAAAMNDEDAGATPNEDATTPQNDAQVSDAGVSSPSDPPPLKPYSGGTCPAITSGATSATSINTGFLSAGDTRSFRVLVPSTYDPSTPTPVVFAWHWLNASSGSFVADGELESAIEEMGFIAVLPDRLEKPNGDKAYFFDWPFVEVSNAPKELTFFDDLLTCVSEQFNVDSHRVYGIGVSAGALWLSYMMSTDRIDYLAAVESLSGGLGEIAGVWQIPFTPRAYKFPAVVLWGGPNDRLGVNFANASMALESALLGNGQFVVECVHTEGHGIPPIEPPMGSGTKFWSLWRFMLDHPYGEPSPYAANGLPAGFPSWCRVP